MNGQMRRSHSPGVSGELLTDIAALPEGASYAALERDPDICALVQSDLVVFENTRPGVGTVQITSFGRSALHHRMPSEAR